MGRQESRYCLCLQAAGPGACRLAVGLLPREGRSFIDISLPFGLRWAASYCQDVTCFVARELERQGLPLLNYIDELGEGAASIESEAVRHFNLLQAMLERLELEEAKHKACPLSSNGLVRSPFLHHQNDRPYQMTSKLKSPP